MLMRYVKHRVVGTSARLDVKSLLNRIEVFICTDN